MSEEQEITQLLANQPIELTTKTDFFNTIPKGDTIVSFINAYTESLKDNKLIALFGDWGSGKTSLIKYIENNLQESNFQTIYFETWKYEKDDNLALSLVDVILEKVNNRSKRIIKNFKEISSSLLINFAKSISFNTPIINIDTGKALENIENEVKQKEVQKSFHKKIEEFKKAFLSIEKQLLKGDKKHLIIFIDDLDRCEPENILNLLTALKHFFSLGEKTIFFCGIDKDAITKAVKHKYKDVIKSEEYLEKIFDLSFNMPQNLDLRRLLDYYLHDTRGYVGIVYKYLHSIEFSNPRHLKKIFNKYLTLKFIQRKGIDLDGLIPPLTNTNSLNVILVLHFIILHEFKKNVFFELKDLDKRMNNLAVQFYEYIKSIWTDSQKETFSTFRERFSQSYEPKLTDNLEIFQCIHFSTIYKFVNLISLIPNKPIEVGEVGENSQDSKNEIIKYVDRFNSFDNIQVSFAKFILRNQSELKSNSLNYVYNNLFEMAEKYL